MIAAAPGTIHESPLWKEELLCRFLRSGRWLGIRCRCLSWGRLGGGLLGCCCCGLFCCLGCGNRLGSQFAFHLDVYLGDDFAVQADVYVVFADDFERVGELDLALINLEALRGEFVGDIL